MATQKLTNLAKSTLASAITNAATSATVATGDGAKFPASGDFYCAITYDVAGSEEIVLCTARAGDVLTITRAQGGTTAKAHSTGAKIKLVIAAETLTALIAERTSPAARIESRAAQSIANGTTVELTFATGAEIFDTDAMADLAVNGRITIKTAGKYLVVAQAYWPANATGRRIAFLYKNGAEIARSELTPGANPETAHNVAAVADMAVNDYFTISVYQTSGGALNSGTTTGQNFLSAVRVG